MKKTTLIPAAGYIRMSTDKQEHSPERQKAEIEKLAKREGCTIVCWYEDLGQTGTESAKRKGFQKLLVDAKSGKFKAVLMYEQSRMSREDPLDALEHLRKLRDAGVTLYTCQRGKIDTSNIAGLLMAVVESHGAHDESLKISARVVSGKQRRAQQGFWQGMGLFGYDRVFFDEHGKQVKRVRSQEKFRKPSTWNVKLEISADAKEVRTVKYIFDRAAAGVPPRQIAMELNRAKWPTPTGKLWVTNYVRSILYNPNFTGDYWYARTTYGRGKFNAIADPILIQDHHPSYISREKFQKIQRLCSDRRKCDSPAPRKPGRYLLSGLVFDATIGAQLFGSQDRYLPSDRFYTRNPDRECRVIGYSREVIETGVIGAIIRAFDDKGRMEQLRRKLSQQRTKEEVAETKLVEQLAAIRTKIERAMDNITLAAAADVPGMSKRLAEFREQEKVLKDQLDALRGSAAPTPDSVLLITKLWKLLPTLGKEKAPEHRELLAHALRKTIKRVVLRTTYHEGVGKYPVKTWSGAIEFHAGFNMHPVDLTDDDIPTPFVWRRALEVVRQSKGAMKASEIAEALGMAGECGRAQVALWMRRAVAAGRAQKLGHYDGWIFLR